MADENDIILRRPNTVPADFITREVSLPQLVSEINRITKTLNANIRELDQTQRLNAQRIEELFREVFRRLALVENKAFGKMLHVSWFGAAHQDVTAMRDDRAVLETKGYNGARVWATWSWSDSFGDVDPNVDSPLDFNGNVVTAPMDKLRAFIGEASGIGWRTEVVLSHNKLGSRANHLNAIENLADAIGDLDGWFLDLANEQEDIGWSLLEPYNLARELLPGVQLTASISGDVSFMAGRYNSDYTNGITWDLLTPHFARTNDWGEATQQRVEDFIDGLVSASAAGDSVHLNEENGLNISGGTPAQSATDWTEAGTGARLGGALGTGFFTTAGFNLKPNGRQSMIDNLRGIEVAGIDNLADGWLGT